MITASIKYFSATLLLVAVFLAPELEQRSVLNDKISILVPKDWKPMPESLKKIKYPGEKPPQLVLSDRSGGLSLAINHTGSKATPKELGRYAQALENSLRNAYPDAIWEGIGNEKINGKQVCYFKVITETADGKIYNQMFFTDLDSTLLIFSFNAIEKRIKDWKPIADSMMYSLRIKGG